MSARRLIWTIPVAAAAAVAAVLLLRGDADEGVEERFFGVALSEQPSPDDFREMAAGSIGHVRFTLYWPGVQPTEDAELDWSGMDGIVRGLAQHGIEPVPIVHGTPAFVAEDPRRAPVGPAEAERAYRAFLRAAVKRYGPGGDFWDANPGLATEPVRVWQIWNEQNSVKFFAPRPSPRKYARLVELSDETIGKADPGAKVLLGGMFGTPSSSRESITAWGFLRRLYEVPGIEARFDGIGVHPYSPDVRGIADQIRLIRSQTRQAGDSDAGIWVSEIGWASEGSGSRLIKSRRGQARMLEKAFDLFVDRREEWNLEGITWYAWRDTLSGDCVWCPHAGLIDRDGRGKPAWSALQSFTK